MTVPFRQYCFAIPLFKKVRPQFSRVDHVSRRFVCTHLPTPEGWKAEKLKRSHKVSNLGIRTCVPTMPAQIIASLLKLK